ncbi:MAG: imidazole glycerol phosphate synthase subunit HisH [Sphingopyxis sp.]
MTRRVVLIDYGAGNIRSVANALRAAGADNIVISATADAVLSADHIVLPGVGAFGACVAALRARDGLVDALESRVRQGGVPFLGICVGMQLLAEHGEEHGSHRGLGWIGGTVQPMAPADPSVRIPHMGWNDVIPARDHPLIHAGEAYFLHGYHMVATNPAHIIANSAHGGPIVAAVGHGNIAGVQFHPEKSQTFGIALLERFLAWRP